MQRIDDIGDYVVILALLVLWVGLFFLRQALVKRQPQRQSRVEETGSRILIGNGQCIGTRDEQDDYFMSATTPVGTLAVIADGISGLSNGRMASTLAVNTFGREFYKQESTSDFGAYFNRAAELSNQGILANLNGSNGGTTLVAAIVSSGFLHWAAVGDSMISVFRRGEFITMNSKHTVENVLREQYLSGEITREEAEASPVRKQLVNYLGYEGFKSMEIGEPFELQKHDKIILASDGIYDALTEVELEEILKRKKTPQEAADAIIEEIEAKALLRQDNATILILEKGW